MFSYPSYCEYVSYKHANKILWCPFANFPLVKHVRQFNLCLIVTLYFNYIGRISIWENIELWYHIWCFLSIFRNNWFFMLRFLKFGNKWAYLISCTLHLTIKWFSIPTHWDGYKFFSGKCFFFGTHFSCYWQPFQNANNLWIIYVAFLPWYSRMQITIDSLHTSFAFIKFSRIQDNSGMVTYYHFL